MIISKLKIFLLSAFMLASFAGLNATIHVFYPAGFGSSLLILSGGHYLDLNNDSFADFSFFVGSSYVSLNSEATGNDFCAYQDGTARALNEGNDILGPFSTSGYVHTYFTLTNYKYIGMRVTVGSDFYYGWASVRVSNNGLHFNSYAYSDVPNQPISAGSLVDIIEESTTGPVELGTNGLELVIRAEQANRFQGEMEVYDLQGRMVKSVSVRQPVTRMSLSQGGLYIAVMRVDGRMVMRKRVWLAQE